MKKIVSRTLIIAAFAVLVLTLNACSGVIGGDTAVRISVGELSGGRYISPSANSGYVVVLDKNKVYSLNNFSDKAYYALLDGYVYITNLPVGDFIFGVVLMDDNGTPDDEDDDDNYGLAIKEVEIKKGYNNVVIDVGPGLTDFYVGTADVGDFLTPDGYSSSFAEDTIILSGVSGVIDLEYSEGSTDPGIPVPGGMRFEHSTFTDMNGDPYSLTVLLD